MADTEYLSTRQAALRLGVSLGTVQNMVESGALEAWKTAGGHRRIPATSVDALLARRRNLTPSALESGGQLDILIAEDDSTLQMLYQMTIESWNLPIKLRIVANGFDGLLQVGQRQPDILIADLMMPGMDGFEMIRRLRANADLARMDIIVVSAIDREEVIKRGLLRTLPFLASPSPSTRSRASCSVAWLPVNASDSVSGQQGPETPEGSTWARRRLTAGQKNDSGGVPWDFSETALPRKNRR
jgi:excisionase family DNA binding protein